MRRKATSVYEDLGFENPQEWEAKSLLAAQIMEKIRKNGWNQMEAAEFLGVKKSEISNINRGQFGRYTIDRLVGYLRKLGMNVDIKLKDARGKKGGRLSVLAS